MLILSRSRFIKTPFVAPLWITRVLEQVARDSNVQIGRVLSPSPYTPLSMAPGKGLFTFAFVRNPYNWYRSYFIKAQATSWNDPYIEPLLRSATFQGFIDNMLNQSPGLATETFQQVTGDFNIDFIGKFEEIQHDLTVALKKARETPPTKWPEIDPSETVTILSGYDLSYRTDQENSILLSDAESYQEFQYDKDSQCP